MSFNPTSEVSLIVDDADSSIFTFAANVTTALTNLNRYQGTTTVADSASTVGEATFVEVLFEGTQIAIVGETPQEGQSFNVYIDGGQPSTSKPSGSPSYTQWYQSPVLANGAHNITISNAFGANIDYAIITSGVSANVVSDSELPIMLDDSEAAVMYEGTGWVKSNATFTESDSSTTAVFPYRNSTHQTSTSDDIFTINFVGSAISVYGIFDWSKIGFLNVTFSLDDIRQTKYLSVGANTSEPARFQPNFEFFSSPTNLQVAPHKLVVTVTACQNQSFIVDYITFRPAASNAFPPAGPTGPTDVPGSSGAVPVAAVSSNKKSHVGAIVGGVLGAVVFLCLTGLLYDCFRRRKRQLRPQFGYSFQTAGSAFVRNGPIPLASITQDDNGPRKN